LVALLSPSRGRRRTRRLEREAARVAADRLNAQGHKTIAIRCDVAVADDAQVEAVVAQTVAAFGGLDAAYNNAGVQNVLAETADTTP
jgi:NAD(P)-dependent dehydrogenase (short-subunit alcohol dehydrogenase family)